MFRSKTLFIIGAGASREVGFPLGLELKQTISTLLDIRFADGFRQLSGDHDITETFRHIARGDAARRGDINPLLHVCWLIRDAMPQAMSIDNFLDAHNENSDLVWCGKLAIAQAILQAEKQSAFYIHPNDRPKLDHGGLADKWFAKLFQKLHEGVSKQRVEQIFNNVSFVSFNCDRSIEQYFPHAIQNYYGISLADAQKITAKLTIIHPYGVCGALPWQGGSAVVEYGERGYPTTLLKVAGQIHTFTERVEDTEMLASIREEVSSADTIVFLGFAYHRLNMELLKLEKRSQGSKVFGTALGISVADCEIVKNMIANILCRDAQYVWSEIRNDLRCGQLFDEYHRALA
jgi:hypothetical protein